MSTPLAFDISLKHRRRGNARDFGPESELRDHERAAVVATFTGPVRTPWHSRATWASTGKGTPVNIITWLLQIILGVYFVAIGVAHFTVPDGLPEQMAWMYDLSTTMHAVSGTAEILGGLGLILPGITRVKPRLVPLAASGLVIVMAGAAVWHVTRGEFDNVASNVVLALLLVLVAYIRFRVRPINERGTSSAESTRAQAD